MNQGVQTIDQAMQDLSLAHGSPGFDTRNVIYGRLCNQQDTHGLRLLQRFEQIMLRHPGDFILAGGAAGRAVFGCDQGWGDDNDIDFWSKMTPELLAEVRSLANAPGYRMCLLGDAVLSFVGEKGTRPMQVIFSNFKDRADLTNGFDMNFSKVALLTLGEPKEDFIWITEEAHQEWTSKPRTFSIFPLQKKNLHPSRMRKALLKGFLPCPKTKDFMSKVLDFEDEMKQAAEPTAYLDPALGEMAQVTHLETKFGLRPQKEGACPLPVVAMQQGWSAESLRRLYSPTNAADRFRLPFGEMSLYLASLTRIDTHGKRNHVPFYSPLDVCFPDMRVSSKSKWGSVYLEGKGLASENFGEALREFGFPRCSPICARVVGATLVNKEGQPVSFLEPGDTLHDVVLRASSGKAATDGVEARIMWVLVRARVAE